MAASLAICTARLPGDRCLKAFNRANSIVCKRHLLPTGNSLLWQKMAAALNGKSWDALTDFLKKSRKGSTEKGPDGSFLKKVWSKAEEGGHTSLCGTTPLEKAEVRQWIEYSVTKVRPLSTAPSGKKNKLKEILQELNAYLTHHTFVVGDTITIADIVLYFDLYSYLLEFEVQERSKWTSVGRWFNLVQENKELKPQEWENIVFLSNHKLF